MFPEKEITGVWLNSRGYLVLSDVNAGKNKVIDALALKVKQGELKEAVHVEVSVSVAGTDTQDPMAKFSDPVLHKKIIQLLEQFSGKREYKKLLVTSASNISKREDIEVMGFEEVLSDVLAGVDRQNYSNPTIRTLQLIKYIIFANPVLVPTLLSKLHNKGELTSAGIDRFIDGVLAMPSAKKILTREGGLPLLEKSFVDSPLARPERLAKLLPSVYSTRSFNLFLRELFSHEKAKSFTKQTSPKQKSLRVFLE